MRSAASRPAWFHETTARNSTTSIADMDSPHVSAFSRRATHTRDLITSLVARDFHARYRDSALGVVWALISPLAQLMTFHFLFQQVLSLNIRRYSSFAFIGLIAWGWFSTTLNQSVRVLK